MSAGRVRSGVAAFGIAAIAWATAGPALTPAAASGHASLATTVSSAVSATAGATVDPALRGLRGRVHVIVQGSQSTEAAITRLGGHITRQLPLISGFSATVPSHQINRIAKVPGVTAVTHDSKMKVMASTPMNVGGLNPPDVYQQVTQASNLKAAGYTGQGVTVALIDTGVSSMADTSSRLVSVAQDPLGLTHAPCINFSGDGTCNDEYGHGTFMAGLIDGTGAASGGQYAGVAPSAKLLSVKIASADGSSDVSTVIAAIQWVVAFRTTYNIKVLNLSLGTDSSQTYMLSPLDYAVEKAWNSGIVTIVSASNLGPASGTISKPADDPFVITVGATDDLGTAALSDDIVAPYSSRGPTSADGLAKPDIVAPGTNVISLAAPGSDLTTMFPPAMAAPYRQGSGTSMSAAEVSGIVADILSAQPTWSPNRIKYALMSTAVPDASTDPYAVGAGLVNGYAALSAGPGLANQNIPLGTGLGSLQADRGTVGIQVNGLLGVSATPLQGEVTAQLTPWNFATMLLPTFTGNSWGGNSWGGNSWGGAAWYGGGWQ